VSEFEDSQDWPLRDFSARLRPPSPPEERDDEEREQTEPEPIATPTQEIVHEQRDEPEPELPSTGSSEVEVLYDEDDPVEEPEPAAEPEGSQETPESALMASAVEEQQLPQPEGQTPEGSVPTETVEELEAPAEEVDEPVADDEPEPQHAAGDLRIPDGYSVLEGSPNGQRRTVAIVVSRFNGEITNLLLDGAMAVLDEAGVERERVELMPVPGAFELPLGAMALARTRRFACVVALGCVIRGETPHFDFICNEAASGLQLAGLETGVPVAFGVLTCETREQAAARAGGDRGNKGAEAARSALEMADVFARLRTPA
jgi:6,7-dimethyl-8-ribityllumazine synthase